MSRELRGRATARWGGLLCGLVLLCAAMVAAHEIWVFEGDRDSGLSWIHAVLEFFENPTGGLIALVIVAIIICIVVGLWCVVAAVRPRPVTHVAWEGMWLRPVDVAHLSTTMAKQVFGVQDAHTVASFRKIRVKVHPMPGVSGISEKVKEALAQGFGEGFEISVKEVGND